MIIPHLRNSVSVVFSVIIFFVYSRDMTMGEIGCFLSHYLIWKDVSAFKFHSELNFLNIYIKKWVLLFDTFWGTFGWLIQFTTKFSKQKQFQLAIYKLLPQADTHFSSCSSNFHPRIANLWNRLLRGWFPEHFTPDLAMPRVSCHLSLILIIFTSYHFLFSLYHTPRSTLPFQL